MSIITLEFIKIMQTITCINSFLLNKIVVNELHSQVSPGYFLLLKGLTTHIAKMMFARSINRLHKGRANVVIQKCQHKRLLCRAV